MLAIFLRSFVVGFSGAVAPGSLLTYTIDKSIKRGAISGLLISLGHALLELVLVFAILLGPGKYLGTDLAKVIIGIIGGAVLIFFGASMVKDVAMNKVSIDFHNNSSDKFGNLAVGGAVVSASNPYFIIWWAGVGLGFIMEAYKLFGIIGVLVFYIGHIASDFVWYNFVSILVSASRSFINLIAYRIIMAVLGICLIGFGFEFIISGLRGVWA